MIEIEEVKTFFPSRARGTIILGSILILFLTLAGMFFWLSAMTPVGWLFALYLAGGIISCLPLPMLSYRLTALIRAYYALDRNRLTIHWGLRTEILPLNMIEWFRPLEDLTTPLPTPPIPLPGAYIGSRMVEGLGKVEFLADSFLNGLMIATSQSIFVISPADLNEFMAAFHRWIEMGSLDEIRAESIQPSFVLGKLWDDKLARALVLASFALGTILLLWVIALITSAPSIYMGSMQTGEQAFRVPSIRLVIYPILFGFIFIMDLIGGTYFYRREDQKYAAYLMWSGGVITPLLILITLFFTTIHL